MRRAAYQAVLWCGGAVTVLLAAAAAMTVSLTDRLLRKLEPPAGGKASIIRFLRRRVRRKKHCNFYQKKQGFF